MSKTIYWHLEESKNVPDSDSWLTPEEEEIRQALRFVKRKEEWLLGRWTAKKALSGYLSVRPDAIMLLSEMNGAPALYINKKKTKHAVSLSHRAGKALCAFSDTVAVLGCDLEILEPRSTVFIDDYFTPEEIELVKRNPAQNHLLSNLIWSAKESVSKVLQLGLKMDTRDISVNIRDITGVQTWCGFTAVAKKITFYGYWTQKQNFILTIAAKELFSTPVCL